MFSLTFQYCRLFHDIETCGRFLFIVTSQKTFENRPNGSDITIRQLLEHCIEEEICDLAKIGAYTGTSTIVLFDVLDY